MPLQDIVRLVAKEKILQAKMLLVFSRCHYAFGCYAVAMNCKPHPQSFLSWLTCCRGNTMLLFIEETDSWDEVKAPGDD